MSARRVVITGVGVCSPIGNSYEAVTESLRARRSGVVAVPSWEHLGNLSTRVAGLVEGIDFADYPRRRVRTMGRVALLAMYATEQALEMAGLSSEEVANGRLGLAYGSTHGSSSQLENYSKTLFRQSSFRGISGSSYLKFMSHTCAANLAERFGVRGRVIPTCSACTSGSQAIGTGFEQIKAGFQDRMICGGAEEIHFTHAGVFDVMYAASKNFNDHPDKTPRPFDADRDGVVVAEGAGTVVLETLESAQARGAKVFAEVLGYGTNCDGLHLTNPSWEGMAQCMRLGLESAGVDAAHIDYVDMHGTGTELGDIAESKATFDVLGDKVPASTQKSYTGHTLGAAGSFETICALSMMEHGYVAPNLTLENLDERCAALNYVVGEVPNAELETVMNNNFAFGGINTSLVFRRLG